MSLENTKVSITEQSDSLKLSILTAQLCQDKLAQNVFILDLRKSESAQSDYFVIASADSAPQVQAITDLILGTSRDYRIVKPKIEGLESMEWVLIDYFDVVVHIMLKETRSFYKLEKLWGDADFYSVDDETKLTQVKYTEVLNIYL